MIKVVLAKLRTLCILFVKPSNVKISGSYFRLKRISFDIDRSSNVIIEMGKGVKLNNLKIYVRGNNHKIVFGDSVRISRGVIWMEDYSCLLKIGNRTTIESAELACTEPNSIIEIGENCMFSKEIEVRTGDSHSVLDSTTNERLNFAKNIKIADRVWVGAHVKILKGAYINSDVVVGIGSVVTGNKPLENNSIYAGFPAKCIKQGISWTRERLAR